MNVLRAGKLFSLVRGLVKNDFAHVSGLMAELHGLPQKLGQHFTLYRGSGLEQYFAELCTKGRQEAVPIGDILQELGLDCADINLYAQASIGQVYRARCGGRVLAVKARYPGVSRKISSDFRTLRLILLPVRLLPLKNSGLLPLLGHLESMLLAECDYMAEAANQEAFHRLFRDDPDILVPAVAARCGRAIASEWAEGISLSGTQGGPDRWFVETYLAFIMKSLKELRTVHSDPHPGNFIITGGGDAGRRLAVLDFGSVVSYTSGEAAAVTRLLLGAYKVEDELAQDLSILGVDDETLQIYRPVLADLVSILLEPLYYIGEYDFAGWRLQYKMNTLMASRSWEKPLAIPPKLLLLLRTLQGLYFYARKGGISVNWHDKIKTCLG